MSVPGIGFTSGSIILAEIGDYRDFNIPEQLAKWCGLAPGLNEYAGKKKPCGITKQRSENLRTVLVEIAQVVAKMSNNKLSRFFNRLRARKNYNVAITALARKLITIICHLLVNQELYQENNCNNPDRAAAFYRSVFGWEIRNWDGPFDYWLVRTGPREEMGIDGGILRRQGSGPCDCIQYLCLHFGVKSIDQALIAIADNQGQIVQPKGEIPGVGWLAYCKDTEGNILGVLEPEPM